jgi:hypothetical protein
MLETRHTTGKDPFAEELERYLAETLHDDIHVVGFQGRSSLPAFLEHTYKLYEATIANRRCVFLAPSDLGLPPADIAKHINFVRAAAETAIVALAAQTLSAHHRARLLKHRVPFVVPGNQLYIPDLAIDLREYFRAHRPVRTDGLSPAAQAVLFDHLLRKDEPTSRPSIVAQRLRYSAMSIGRAFDDLVALGLAETDKLGKERHLRFKYRGRQLFDAAQTHLRSPVRSAKYVKGQTDYPYLLHAGETALAELTDLSQPRTPTYALAASAWKTVARERQFSETDKFDADFVIETWSYDPSALSSARTVDPLSLYAQFREHSDPRVAGAADHLLEQIEW